MIENSEKPLQKQNQLMQQSLTIQKIWRYINK